MLSGLPIFLCILKTHAVNIKHVVFCVGLIAPHHHKHLAQGCPRGHAQIYIHIRDTHEQQRVEWCCMMGIS